MLREELSFAPLCGDTGNILINSLSSKERVSYSGGRQNVFWKKTEQST
jgi:hypothetical protein